MPYNSGRRNSYGYKKYKRHQGKPYYKKKRGGRVPYQSNALGGYLRNSAHTATVCETFTTEPLALSLTQSYTESTKAWQANQGAQIIDFRPTNLTGWAQIRRGWQRMKVHKLTALVQFNGMRIAKVGEGNPGGSVPALTIAELNGVQCGVQIGLAPFKQDQQDPVTQLDVGDVAMLQSSQTKLVTCTMQRLLDSNSDVDLTEWVLDPTANKLEKTIYPVLLKAAVSGTTVTGVVSKNDWLSCETDADDAVIRGFAVGMLPNNLVGTLVPGTGNPPVQGQLDVTVYASVTYKAEVYLKGAKFSAIE